MTPSVTAVFENGVLRPTTRPDLAEGATVRLLILPDPPPPPPKSATDPFMQLAGMFDSGVPDAADRHNEYLGQALYDELQGRSTP